MRCIFVKLAATTFTVMLAGLVASPPAFAHEGRVVAGKYNFVVGWGDEPTYNGFKNSAQLTLSDANHKPIADLKDTLQVDVIAGDKSITVPVEPNFEVGEFGTPGDYRAWIVPTRAGQYTFHFTGTIRGDKIDERFMSSDTTFSPVADVSEVEFPAKDPTAGQVAERLDRDTGRLRTALASARKRANDSNDKATLATAIGIAGVVLGGLGLLVGGLRRRS